MNSGRQRTVWLSDETWEKLRAIAFAHRCSIAKVIRETMTVLAWHFLSADRRLGYGDGRLVKKGQTLRVEGEPALCWNGLHGSRRLIDALSNALGPIIERVEIGADKPYEIVAVENKLVGTWRKTLWWIDATMVLHEFACREAEEALRDVGITDERYWDRLNSRLRIMILLGLRLERQLRMRLIVQRVLRLGVRRELGLWRILSLWLRLENQKKLWLGLLLPE